MKHAFTLIELLVVIAIIAILAAILFPVFAEAKRSAQQTVCLSNMKQISLATKLYLSDWDDVWFPAARQAPLAGFAPQEMWIGYDNSNEPCVQNFCGDVTQPAVHPIRPGLIDLYLKNEGVKRCPSMPQRFQMAIALNGWYPGFPSDFYATHPEAEGKEFGPASKTATVTDGVFTFTTASDSEIEEVANTLIAWEHEAPVPFCNFLQRPDWLGSPPSAPNLVDHFNLLHRKGTNTIWADGHVKRMPYGALKRPMFVCNKSLYSQL